MTPNVAVVSIPWWVVWGNRLAWGLWQALQFVKLFAWLIIILAFYKRFPRRYWDAVQHYIAGLRPATHRRNSSMTNLTNPALRAPRAPFLGLCSSATLDEMELAGRRFEYARIFKKADRPKPQAVIGMLVTATLVMPKEGDPCICAIDKIVPPQDTPSGNGSKPADSTRPVASTEGTEGPSTSGSEKDPKEPKKPSAEALSFLEVLREEREITEDELRTIIRIRFKKELKDKDPQNLDCEVTAYMVLKATDYCKR